MRFAKLSAAVAAAAFCASTTVAGQHGHAPAPAHAMAATSHANGATTHPSATTTTHASRPTHRGSPQKTQATSHTATAIRSKPTTSTTGSATGTTTASSPVGSQIESRPQLAAKVTAMLPAGMTVEQAAAGFRNQGQFLAALHVSRNLGISFADLKSEMVRNHKTLGQAIQQLKPSANATREAEHGDMDAEHDVQAAGATTASTTTTTSASTTGSTPAAASTSTTRPSTTKTKHARKTR